MGVDPLTLTRRTGCRSSASPKGPSLGVLPAQTDVDPFFEQRAKGHVLSQGPVTHALAHHGRTRLQDTTEA